MHIHHLQTGTVSIKSSHRLLHGPESLRLMTIMLDQTWTEKLPISAWVIEHPEGIIVIDVGETARVNEPDYFAGLNGWVNRQLLRLDVKPEDEIEAQLQQLGIRPSDVRWVVMTHLHSDHTGGLHHFPKAEILVSRAEFRNPYGALPNRWPSWFNPRLVDYRPEPIGTFSTSYPITRAGDVRIVPTLGHSPGHQSVILEENGASIFFAGDAAFSQARMLKHEIAGIAFDVPNTVASLDTIQAYVHNHPTVFLPSHDPESAKRLAMREVIQLAGAAEFLMQL